MSRLPPPPANFGRLSLVTESVDPSQLLRIARTPGTDAFAFRRTALFRFDAPDATFGVLYAAFDFRTAFAETLVRDAPRARPASERIMLELAELQTRVVVPMASGVVARPLKLAKLLDGGLVAARIDNRIASADDYATT